MSPKKRQSRRQLLEDSDAAADEAARESIAQMYANIPEAYQDELLGDLGKREARKREKNEKQRQSRGD